MELCPTFSDCSVFGWSRGICCAGGRRRRGRGEELLFLRGLLLSVPDGCSFEGPRGGSRGEPAGFLLALMCLKRGTSRGGVGELD